jgi:hypothetical protein
MEFVEYENKLKGYGILLGENPFCCNMKCLYFRAIFDDWDENLEMEFCCGLFNTNLKICDDMEIRYRCDGCLKLKVSCHE